MSSDSKNNTEKKIFELRLNNNSLNNNRTLIYDSENNSYETLMKKENLLESKLNFMSIFEKINKNKQKYNKVLLNNIKQKEKKIRNIISIDRLVNYIYQSGTPYKGDFKKKFKQNILKEKVNQNLEIKKISLGSMDYYNLDTFSKDKISKLFLKRKNENKLKNFISKKSGIFQNVNISGKNNKNKTKSGLYIPKINNNIKSENNIRKTYSIFNYNPKNRKNIINSSSTFNKRLINSTKSIKFKDSENRFNLSNKTIIETESKKIINSYKENKKKDLLKNQDNNILINNFPLENTKENSSGIMSEEGLKKSINKKKAINNLKIIIYRNNKIKTKIDENLQNFKNSISDLNKYNKIRNDQLNTIGVNDTDFLTKEEKIILENKKFERISKNLLDINDKIRKSMNYYDIVMNRQCLTERNKTDKIKITKMFSSSGKKTINNMVTDLGICQNHIKDKLINVFVDSSYKRKNMKEIDPTLEIILDKKIKNQNNTSEYDDMGEDYDLIKDVQSKNYEKKEINRIGETIGKMNNKVAIDLSKYLLLYNKNMGNKIETMKEEKMKKERNNIQRSKKSIEYQIYNLKRIKQRNIFEYNKIIHKFNDFYTKIKNEKKLNEEYRKLFFQNQY